MRSPVFFLLFLLYITVSFAQGNAVLSGIVTDGTGPIPGVNVLNLKTGHGTSTDSEGKYNIELDAEEELKIVFSFIGYMNDTVTVNLQEGQQMTLDKTLISDVILIQEVNIKDHLERQTAGGVEIDVKKVETIPTPFGNIESALATQALGVAANNELSTAYSVRGGNFDENLVYVNDFEVFRPFLIRSGQQEGLSFINSNLVNSVFFSSGGFESKYGDKQASVLDVKYKKPKDFAGSVEIGLLGAAAHLEGSDKKNRFTFLAGFRYKNSQYLLNSLETSGQYSPSFLDFQSYLTYKVNDKVDLEWIANYARNRYSFVPVDRETTFGVVNNVLRLTVYFDGQERDQYDSFMSGFSINHRPNRHLGLKWLASAYRSEESEAFDIIGEYFLGEVETDFGSEDFGQTRYSLGVGTVHDFTRTDLKAIVANAAHKGYYIKGNHNLKWGITYQREIIEDRINEWDRLDSAGYSLPYNPDEVGLSRVLKSKFNLGSNRINAYVQDTRYFGVNHEMSLTYGTRITYWDVNKDWLFSPRLQFSITPDIKADIVFRAAAGLYGQPPFYREMRDLDGKVNTNLKAQKSIHAIVGFDYNFKAWGRNFKFVSELYYKYLYDQVPYEFDNVFIRYFGENLSKGYVAGIDFRLHGELVKGADSWISMSVMSTQEDVAGDFRVSDEGDTTYPGFLPRPTDQRIRFSMFFQDYFPTSETFKVHLNLVFATGLPFGPPDRKKYNDQLRVTPYRRIDIGFSALLFDPGRKETPPKNFFRHFKSIWATLEIYNLLGINNTVSYLWIKDISNTVYAVPNFLTNRRFNLRIIFKF